MRSVFGMRPHVESAAKDEADSDKRKIANIDLMCIIKEFV